MSHKQLLPSSRRSMDWEPREAGSRFGHPSAMMRSVEIQTDQPNHTFGEYQDAYEMLGGSGVRVGDGGFADDGYPDEAAQPSWQAMPMSGYGGLPVTQPLPFMNPYGKTVTLGPLSAAGVAPTGRDGGGIPPFYRAGRNGSNWRHVTQCIGNLGNHMVYINGRVKADDCQRFPPHGFNAGFGPGAQALPAGAVRTAAPQATTRRPTTGLPGPLASKALQRARAGNKYWYEDKRPPTLTPSTIQGRIMKSGAAY